MPEHVQHLVRRMAAGNPLWGQERIAGELSKLGLDVSPRAVAKHLGDRSWQRRRPSMTCLRS